MIEAVRQIAAYAPPAVSNIQLAQLTALLASYRAANTDLAAKTAALTSAQRARSEAYDGDEGLREKMKAIKESAKALYGSNSSEYLSIKGIRV